MKTVVFLLVLMFFMSGVKCDVSDETNAADLQARIFLRSFDKRFSKATNAVGKKHYAYNQNSTDITQKELVEETANRERLGKILSAQAEQFNLSKVSNYIKRSLKAAIYLTSSSKLEESKGKELTNIIAEMTRIRNLHPEVCLSPTRCFSFHSVPSISDVFHQSQNTTEMAEVFKGLISNNNRKIKPLYTRYVELKNEGARLQGFKDYGEQWRSNYEQSNLEEDAFRLLDHIKLLHRALHTFVKYHLKKLFGAKAFPSSGHIPVHLLYTMHRPSWEPNKYKPIDVSQALKNGRYTVRKVYDAANDFYKSLGFPGMPPSVWNNSSLGRPEKGQNKQCHPTAWDFYDRHDYRMSMCVDVSHRLLRVLFHEMGHIVYFQQYTHQPVYFYGAANEAFHESMGDVMGMSAESPEHLKKIGLIKRSYKYDVVGFLLRRAMSELLGITEKLTVDLFRWAVFNGSIKPENYNKEWWRLQCKYHGVSPPVNRSRDDFDLGGIYHVVADYSVIRYYIGNFIQYNLYEQSCRDKGHKGDLHLCDISGNKLVGAKFRNFMREGTSRPWKDILRDFTGSEDINPESMINYYKPLYNFLINNSGNETSGWNDECDPYPTVE